MEAQDYIVEDVYVYQDNYSAILLENNGAQSIRKGSRYMQMNYFFITDKIKSKEIRVTYCPTKQMSTDFFTKPLQGVLYFTYRNSILGINEENMPIYMQSYELYHQSMKIIAKP